MSYSQDYIGDIDFPYIDDGMDGLQPEEEELVDNFDLYDQLGFNLDDISTYQYAEPTSSKEVPHFESPLPALEELNDRFDPFLGGTYEEDPIESFELRTSSQLQFPTNITPLLLEEDLADYLQPSRAYPNKARGKKPKKATLNTSALEPRRVGQNTTTGKSSRTETIKNFNPSDFYDALSQTPAAWGPVEESGKPRFSYDQYGELDVTTTFSAEEITHYLYSNPAHYVSNAYNPMHGSFILWIQTCPADSSKRYPYAGSDKCRFANCPVDRNTIHKGSFRAAFDEHARSAIKVDPYHAAGFVHLFCLEKFLDFPQLCRDIRVLPDCRELPEGRNRMAINRDFNSMEKIARKHIRRAVPGAQLHYEETLNSKLTVYHLNRESDGRQRIREARGGNNIGLHKGNLDVYAAAQAERRKPKKEAATKKASKKRGTPSSSSTSYSNSSEEYAWKPAKKVRKE